MTQHKCVQLDHVLQMYHVGYHKGHLPSPNREPPVESATSITVQHARPQWRRTTRNRQSTAPRARQGNTTRTRRGTTPVAGRPVIGPLKQVIHCDTFHYRVMQRWVTGHDAKRVANGAFASVESVGQAGGALDDTHSGSRDELFSIQIMLYFTLREQRHGPIKRCRVEKTCSWSGSDAFRVAGCIRTEPGSTLAPLFSTVSTRLVSLRECAPQRPGAPCPHRLLR